MKTYGLNNMSVRDVLPVDPSIGRFAGLVLQLRYVPMREDMRPEQALYHPANLITPIVESIPAGAMIVMDANGENDVDILDGKILMRLKTRGVAAAVTNGGMRAIPEIDMLGIPVCCTTSAPPPSFTKLMLADSECILTCGGVPIFPGDIIVGDDEGTVAIPAEYAAAIADDGLAQDHIED